MRLPPELEYLQIRMELLLQDRFSRLRENSDSGMEVLQAVVIAAIGLTLAVGLAGLISNAVTSRQEVIK